MRRRRALLAVVALGACSPPDRGPRWRPAGNASPRDGGTLRYATKQQVRTLDPSIAYDEVGLLVLHPLFDTLLDYEPSGAGDLAAGLHLIPRLAARWEISSDRLTYTFELRPGITFSDGSPVVAADFKYSLERTLGLAESPFGSFLGNVVGATAVTAHARPDCAGIEARSERELVLRLVHPDPAFLYVMAMTFVTPQQRAHVEAAGDQLRRQPLGTGPYVLEAWDEGTRIVLRRNARYVDPTRAHLERIVMAENVPADTQFLMFERGELDAVDHLAPPDLLWVISQPVWQPYVHHRALLNATGVRMNVRRKPFDDRRVRQALNYAVDKRHLVTLMSGAAIAAHGVLPPGVTGRDDTLAPYPHDPTRARALLAEAGYPGGFDVDYVTFPDVELERVAASLQHDLGEVGVRVRISLVSFATWLTTIGKPDGAAFSLASWSVDYPDPSDFVDVQFHSKTIADENSVNNTFYANPALDALLDAATTEPDPGARLARYRQAEHLLYDDAPWIWGFHPMVTEVTQPYVRGYEPHPIWLRDYTSAWLDVGPDGEPVPR